MNLRFYILFAIALIHSACYSQNKEKPFSFFVLGDMPYNLPGDYLKFENVIKELNKQDQVFNVFVGDIKSSRTLCTDSVYQKMFNYFNDFKQPLIYTPGDNEWTDCGAPKAGSYNTYERLTALRALFFKDPLHSLGKNTLPLASQSSNAAYLKFVENQMWQYNRISFGTVHLVGSNNNLELDPKEYEERSKANIFWLHELFMKAKKDNSLGIVLLTHADMFTPDKGKEGFLTFLDELHTLVSDYKKPVLLINGDSHAFKIDKLFTELKNTKKTLLNFTRLQVFGDDDMDAVKVVVNPKNPMLFEIHQFLIPQP